MPTDVEKALKALHGHGVIKKLVSARAPLHPSLRGANVPFHFDADTLRSGMNFTLTTILAT
jgi:hypothetical protein